MIMPRGAGQLLLPANPLFVWFTLAMAFALNIVPLGRNPAMPDFVALVLVFWNVNQPRRVGVGVAFMFGLMMDVHDGAILGQHALAYTLLSFFAITIHRRLRWFTVPSQALQILPLFVAAHAVSFIVRMIAGNMLPGWELLLAPLFESLLWPLANWVLLAPQRRAPDRDENRPL
ncbi:MAG: rod shape-determining protein MreD [Betaproteobacteria bacterium]|jgi:rod shape-determining protein MreD|nr:MAG: rod shape-determining protein MreD [Betaproteobacteria bacterium]TMH30559.1 MAG: rod shape-determining protein MreD [Betaproteobacteria bacterium]